jgi:regulator of replication initiation timing
MEQLRTENKRLRTENDSMRNRIAVLEQQLAASRPARQDSPPVQIVAVTRTDDPTETVDLSGD